jgi:hypothetical protein
MMVRVSTIATQSLGSVKILVQAEKDSLDAIAMEIFSTPEVGSA